MRDKENRRAVVFFLHNYLHHFELFNGLHISKLYARVSCGKDYLSAILDSDTSPPPFFVPPHHILTISSHKQLGQPIIPRSPEPIIEAPLSPFCLDEPEPSPHTPPFSLRRSRLSDSPSDSPLSAGPPRVALHSAVLAPREQRNRSVSMFERLCTESLLPENGEPAGIVETGKEEAAAETVETEKKVELPVKKREKEVQRPRTYSVHDVILQPEAPPPPQAVGVEGEVEVRGRCSRIVR